MLPRSKGSCPKIGALLQHTLEDGVPLGIPPRFALQPERLDTEFGLKREVKLRRNRFLARVSCSVRIVMPQALVFLR